MNYVESFNLLGVEAQQIPCIKGSGAPSSTTEGAVGCLYMDTDTGDVYKCIEADNDIYVWESLIEANHLGCVQDLYIHDDTSVSGNHILMVTKGDGSTYEQPLPNITVDDELSDTSENPVQNKVITEALEELKSSNEFYGKTAVFLGDSQTEVNGHKTKIYFEWIKDILGLGTCFNFGLSGSTITNNGASSMSVRYENMPINADIIFVMGGVNDVWFNQPLGSTTDTTDTTYYGAVRSLCRNLKTKYPKKPIIFITPTLQNHSDCVHNEGVDVTTFATAMKDVCYKEGVLCLDAHGGLGINPYYDNSYTTDGLHLNDLGNELLGKWIAKQVKNNVVIFEAGETPDTSKLCTVQSTNDGTSNFHIALYVENNDVTNFATNTGKTITANIIFKNESYSIGGLRNVSAFGVDILNDLSAGYELIAENSTGTLTENDDGTKTLSIIYTTTYTTNKPYICIPNLISVGVGWSFELVDAFVTVDGVRYNPVYIGGAFAGDILTFAE